MSEKYKDALDKIVVTDELKEKIIKSASLKKTTPTPTVKVATNKFSYSRLRYGMNIAACFLICVCALLSSKYVYSPGVPIVTETPIHSTPTSKQDKPEQNNKTNVADAQVKSNNIAEHNTVSVARPNHQAENIVTKNPPPNTANVNNPSVLTENGESNTSEKIDIDIEPPAGNTDLVLQGSPEKNTDLITNPIYTAENIEEMQKQVGYAFKLPQYLPEDYTVGECGVLFGSLVEINYNSLDNNILYRTENKNGNISGDYNNYEKTETEVVNNTEVTLKSTNDLYYNAVWNDDSAYALNIENGLDKETLLKIIESVDYSDDITNETNKDSAEDMSDVPMSDYENKP